MYYVLLRTTYYVLLRTTYYVLLRTTYYVEYVVYRTVKWWLAVDATGLARVEVVPV